MSGRGDRGPPIRTALAAVVGAVVAGVGLGMAGYALGYVMLAGYGGRGCCGLEGLFPLVIGVLSGGALGLVAGGAAGRALARGSRPRPSALLQALLLWGAAVGLAYWAGRARLLHLDIEGTADVWGFFGVTLGLPVVLGAWLLTRPTSRR